jgi:hypothetical protein
MTDNDILDIFIVASKEILALTYYSDIAMQ